MDCERTLLRSAQTGRVSNVDEKTRKVRVIFDVTDHQSDWLYVLQHPGMGVAVTPDNAHSHGIPARATESVGDHGHPGSEFSVTPGGGHLHGIPAGQTEGVPDHEHPGTVTTIWLPRVNDRVLVLYLPAEDGDGFVLGVI